MAFKRPQDHEQALVVVPTYNEIESIAEAARRLFAATGDSVDLLVIDDASPDGTAALVKQMAEGPHDIHLIERRGKEGLGSAYVAGFRWALDRGYRAVVEMDADISHNPADVPRLLDALDHADLVIGSRYVPGGKIVDWSNRRKALSRMGNVYTGWMLGHEVQDWTSGFRAFRASVLARLDLASVRSDGYAFQIEMAYRVLRAGGRVLEVPITFVERAHGSSKMSRRIILEALLRVTRWGAENRLGRRAGER